MITHAVLAALLLRQEREGLTLTDILADIPRDPAAIFIYLLIVGAVFLVWLGSRKKPDERADS